MQKFASKDSQCSLLHLQRHEVLLFVILLMVDFVNRHTVLYIRTIVKLSFVAAWKPPKATVLDSCILQGNPKTEQCIRVTMKKVGILMYGNSSSDFWRFQNSHRLNNQRASDANFIADLFNSFSVSNALEYIIMLVQGMGEFVDGLTFLDLQLSVFPYILLEEETHASS